MSRLPGIAAAALLAACAAAPAPVAEPPRAPQPAAAQPDRAAREIVVLLPEADGSVGALTIAGGGREVVLTQPYTAAVARGPEAALGGPETLDPRQVERDFAGALGVLPPRPLRFVLNFEKGTSDLTAASREQLREIATTIADRAALDVSVIGHADASGPEDVNIELSRRRAEEVADSLVKLGIDRAVLDVGSHGSRVPLVPGVVDEPRNRRVEVTVR